jgi:N-acetylglucosamine-6-sulfatase
VWGGRGCPAPPSKYHPLTHERMYLFTGVPNSRKLSEISQDGSERGSIGACTAPTLTSYQNRYESKKPDTTARRKGLGAVASLTQSLIQRRGEVRRVLGLVMSVAVILLGTGCDAEEHKRPQKPNIVFILTDDLDDDSESIAHMENLRSLVTDSGVTLKNAYVTQSLCCPSRASILRGQYPHNTGVTSNRAEDYADFVSSGREASTFATWVHDAGYQTAYFGKYLNGYDTTRIPPGWDRWFSDYGATKDQQFNDQGTLVTFDPNKYLFDDVLHDKTLEWLKDRDDSKPFLAVVSTHAPHQPAIPAPRHANLFPGADLPKPASFNEAQVSDKNEWVRHLPPLSRAQIGAMERLYPNRLRVMEGVDEMLEAVVSELRAQGELENTYIFFSSDNGFHMGQHRFNQGKETAYEEDIAVPMIVRGPGVTEGATRQHLILNQDLAPTFADIADASVPNFVDGRSFLAVLGDNPPDAWRTGFLVRAQATDNRQQWIHPMPTNYALRTARYEYIDYPSGKDELYDMERDPYQIDSIQASAPTDVLAQMRAQLESLQGCVSDECRAAEGP